MLPRGSALPHRPPCRHAAPPRRSAQPPCSAAPLCHTARPSATPLRPVAPPSRPAPPPRRSPRVRRPTPPLPVRFPKPPRLSAPPRSRRRAAARPPRAPRLPSTARPSRPSSIRRPAPCRCSPIVANPRRRVPQPPICPTTRRRVPHAACPSRPLLRRPARPSSPIPAAATRIPRSLDFLQTGSAVSTGLALSLEDRRHGGGSWAGNSSGDSPLLLLPMLDDDISREVQRLDADMDRFIKAQSERLRHSILEKVQAKQFEALASVEDKILRKIRDKEVEVETINKRNSELEDQIKQLAVEVGAWQQRAKYNESMINALKYNLEQVCAHQSKDLKEGCGDSEVDDTASCCNGGPANLQLMLNESRQPKDLTACRVCKSSEACMLLLPCRHLCLCKECESKLSFCPLCQSSKILGMEIYM